jgi:hypothetical protein
MDMRVAGNVPPRNRREPADERRLSGLLIQGLCYSEGWESSADPFLQERP